MRSRRSLNVLIVEDEALAAADLEGSLEACGHKVAGVAANSREAFDISARSRVDVALVDLNLTDGSSGASLARVLARAHGVGVIFVTGNPDQIPDDFCGALGVVAKPYDKASLGEVLKFADELTQTLTRRPRAVRLAPCLEGLARAPGPAI